MKRLVTFLTLGYLLASAAAPSSVVSPSKYKVKDGWIVGENTGRYNNRPLYLHNTNAFVLAGDMPLMRFAKDNILYGSAYFNLVLDKDTISFQDFDSIKSMYRAGEMRWELSLSEIPNASIALEVQKLDPDFGACLHLSANNLPQNAHLQLVREKPKTYESYICLSWEYDVMGHPDLLSWGKATKSDIAEIIEIKDRDTYCQMTMMKNNELEIIETTKDNYEICKNENSKLVGRLKIDTPDQYLNSLAEASVIAVDGSWYPPVFVHGCLQWNRALPGWRTIYGGTMYGWHQRVQEQARYYIDSQVRVSDKKEAKADSSLLLTHQHADSRFYGVGHIEKDQSFYDMQSQFFDQLIEEYRWNPDSVFVALLRPALELHLQWLEECFDPDGDGLYESYINTWPTDSQWYNGGGSAEATSYAYNAHKAALDMALAANDQKAAAHHRVMLKRIRDGFNQRLWINGRGHSGAYREQGGYQRVHIDPWLYSIFLPIDAGLTSDTQSIESLYYTEWALQNDKMPLGGRRVWTSNWVPAAWSVREMWPGDNYHLALAYFLAGLPSDGWDIMKGTFMHGAYGHTVPGNLGSDQGGIDFGDCVHPFARTLVSGLFGFRPDYPNGKAIIAPSFPDDWNQASLSIPDYSIDYRCNNGIQKCSIVLPNSTNMEIRLPAQGLQVKSVKANGKEVKYKLEPAPGRATIVLILCDCNYADIEIEWADEFEYEPICAITGEVDSQGSITLGHNINKIIDSQKAFKSYSVKKGKLKYKLGNQGHHTVIAEVKNGAMTFYKILRIKTTDTAKMQADARKAMIGEDLHGNWVTTDISKACNADVQEIYKQKYLSPRPNTVSVRIGVDGFSPWTFPYWGTTAPEIKLDSLSTLVKGNELMTPQGVPFHWSDDKYNIAFVSLWDNYPDSITINMNGQKGETICFLVCGSTNMMQCNNENAEILINYEDGTNDALSLTPPINYWNLCPIDSHASAPGQFSRSYYTSEIDRFCMPDVFPHTVGLGENCRAMVLPRRLEKGKNIKNVTLKCSAQEVVVGLMGISIK